MKLIKQKGRADNVRLVKSSWRKLLDQLDAIAVCYEDGLKRYSVTVHLFGFTDPDELQTEVWLVCAPNAAAVEEYLEDRLWSVPYMAEIDAEFRLRARLHSHPIAVINQQGQRRVDQHWQPRNNPDPPPRSLAPIKTHCK